MKQRIEVLSRNLRNAREALDAARTAWYALQPAVHANWKGDPEIIQLDIELKKVMDAAARKYHAAKAAYEEEAAELDREEKAAESDRAGWRAEMRGW